MATTAPPSVWRNHAFVRLWAAGTVSTVGDMFSAFAIPLLVFTLTGSPAQTGASLAVTTAPYVLVSPFAGALVDRRDRRQILVWTRSAEAVLLATIPAAAAAGVLTLVQIYVVGFLGGALAMQFGAASLSITPQLVAPDQLVAANAAQQLSVSAAQLAGPPLAGLVVALTGHPVLAIAVDAGTFALAAIALVGLPRTTPTRAVHTLLADIREGLAYLARHRLVRALALLLFTLNVLDSGVLGLLVVYGRTALHLEPFGLSLLYTAAGAGAVLAAATASRLGRRFTLTQLVVTGLAGLAAGTGALAGAPNLPAAALCLAIIAATQTVVFVTVIAFRQAIVPDRLQGRVNATARALAVAGSPVGALGAGLLVAPLGGTRPVFALLAALGAVNATAAAVVLRRVTLPT